ncbi:MAG: hypothetical protein IPI07_04460 [Flavobacteriales bacterium]|jgi:hypothetical protein|nr:hypothetical protein [Flavobacteriales bacterium]MBK9074434.1 hypothetical protein [Flavobacteriales bacterium]MBK9537969.1 hypothetical protein [Flavobacteriales bacterium]
MRLRKVQGGAFAIACSLWCTIAAAQAWTFQGDTTPTWEQVIARYRDLDERHRGAKLFEIGKDDGGSPIHLFVISDGGVFGPDSLKARGKRVLFINNGIHPGEPDGIDASLLLAQALLESDQLMGLTVNTVVCIVPVYNVSGALVRDTTFRVDQNGPRVHGQRANARNLDLNRDLVKVDSRNTQTLLQVLRRWDPDIFIDTHVSNGADHQYVMELLTTHPAKLDPEVAAYLDGTLVPGLYKWMDRKKIAMCPYFETVDRTPEQGLVAFFDTPRYTTGYTALFNTIGLMAESHMLKPYADRVNATFQLMLGTLVVMDEHGQELKEIRDRAKTRTTQLKELPLRWTLDTTKVERLPFKGYRAEQRPSAVTGLSRLYYDRTRPVDLEVPWMDSYTPGTTRTKPKAYLIPQAWREVSQRLALNGITFQRVERDTVLEVEVYRIGAMNTVREPFEGHYLHRDVAVHAERMTITARAGDLLVPMDRATDRFVMAVLEPEAPDSYFAWGFFDSVLQQKEWFSDYVFEDVATHLLAKDPALKAELEAKRAADPEFAKDALAQLAFVFERSPYMEPGYRRYPVCRVVGN